MKPRKIETVKELLEFMPKLLELHKSLDGKWEPDLTPFEFAQKLIEHFEICNIYAEQNDEKILYFAAIMLDTKPKAKFWVLYINTDLRTSSVELINSMLEDVKTLGFSSIEFNTKRLTQSYKRWTEKFGAKPKYITYEKEL